MNTNNFFKLCKENGVDVAEVTTSKSKSFEFSIFKNELENYKISTSGKTIARGIYNNKLGFCSTEKDDKTTPSYLVKNIISSARYIEKDEEPIIFSGSEKYHKKNVYNKELENWSNEDKINRCFELEKLCYAKDSRITNVIVSYGESVSEVNFANTYGLNLKVKRNHYIVIVEIVIQDGEEVKTYGDYILSSVPSDLVPETFAKKLTEGAASLLHGVTPVTGTYKAVFSPDALAHLLSALVSHMSAEEVQKHTSKFEGKLNEKVVSNKITLLELPLSKNIFFSYFDDEGVATTNKTLIKKGVLQTYLYNLETAKKDNVASTGNATRVGGKMDIDTVNLVLKPGKLTEEELFAKVNNGIYVTDLTGIHAGLNAKSGDFSLQAEGFLIEDGKKSKPLGLFTVGGNLFDLFNNVLAVGNNSKQLIYSITLPSMAVKNVKISG